ncbi:MAG TPA: hypothetical protein VN700_15225 [Vicinamibacterales bacterium]|nr:hypothetical protein [Vicinamibacterales bacterium]
MASCTSQPPLYRIDIAKDTHWALDDKHKDDILEEAGGGKIEITRFKGLGEMMPKVLWETIRARASSSSWSAPRKPRSSTSSRSMRHGERARNQRRRATIPPISTFGEFHHCLLRQLPPRGR